MSQYKTQQLQSLLPPIHTVLDDLQATAVSASTTASLLSAQLELVCSNIAADLERLAQGISGVVSRWEILSSPAQLFPALKVVNQFPPVPAFLPDLAGSLPLPGI